MLHLIELEDLHSVLDIVILLQLLYLCQMQEPQDELESHLPDRLPQQEESHDLQERQPVQVSILAESRYDSAEAQHFRIELELAHEDATADFDLVLVGIGLQVAVLALNRSEEEPLEEADHELLLFWVSDVELAEARVCGDDGSIDLAIEVLNRHEVFNDSLAETIAEELESNLVSFLEWLTVELTTVADRLCDHVETLWLLRLEAAASTCHPVDDRVCILNFLGRLELLLRRS